VNAGQVGLAVDRLLSWLDERRDVKSVFMIHDTIPIDHTEFVTRSGSKFHHAMLANSARYASGLIVTTQTAQKSILSALDQAGRKEIRTIAVPLPVAPEFLETERETDAELGAVPYFVFCGAIEPRKNLLLLLNVWRELATRLGLETPKLVIVGARGAAEGETVAMLERCAAIRNYIVEAPGLSSLSLRRLIAGARALLMPSFAEGFGLPIIEALSVGTPVIASDTPAHREVGGHYPTYLSPIDGLGWLEAVCKHAGRDFANRGGSTSYVPFTWNAYFERIDPFIASVATPDRTRQAV
jgi:glycosyltransferase involved in cell wall biosynthesis